MSQTEILISALRYIFLGKCISVYEWKTAKKKKKKGGGISF